MRPGQDPRDMIERRRNQIRTVLFLIILATLPFYPIGVWLWANAPDNDAREQILTEEAAPTQTVPPLDETATNAPPSSTPRPTWTPAQPLDPTPIQIFPQPTVVFIPSSTPAPSFTPLPQATFTPLPSFTPLPTFTPLPLASDTPIPLPSNTPPAIDTPILPPTDTPAP